ncbi:Alpha-L-fucosidase [Bertholletia excelsa]
MDWKSQWERRKTLKSGAIGVALVAAFSVITARGKTLSNVGEPRGCNFPAMFNFGDSNSDTGSVSAAFNRFEPPNGRTFFGKPSGRYSDGRLIIDFMAEKLGLPYLSPYLDAVGAIEATFRHGTNFAASGATIRPVIFMSPFPLSIQISQFAQLKARTIELYNQAERSNAKSFLPRPEDFSKALYTVDIGQNDLHAGLISNKTEEQVQASIPSILYQFAEAVENLYQQGARAFWIHNTGPIGCLPFFVMKLPPKSSNTDRIGCIKSYNAVAQEFNKQLKQLLSQLRTKFQNASLTYIDIYSAKYSLISEAKEHGFVHPFGYCCGHHGDHHNELDCGKMVIVNGVESVGPSCSNPCEYISWDGVHLTEAANHWVGLRVLDGSLSDPQLPVTEACLRPVE